MMGDSDTRGIMSEKRIRQYYVGHPGPYIVNIRAVNSALESKKIQKFVFEKYKHVKEVKQVNQYKLRVVFQESTDKDTACSNFNSAQVQQIAEAAGGDDIEMECSDLEMDDNEKTMIKKRKIAGKSQSTSTNVKIVSAREEANDLPKRSEWNSKYRVYIPEKFVETKGVITLPTGHNEMELMTDGCGRFRHALIKKVKILETNRIKRKNEMGNLEDTNAVVVTFEGLLLPNVCDYGKLLIPIREYKIRQMFCSKCKKFSHTKSTCNNKEFITPAEIKCVQCQSAEHESGSAQCPKRKQIEKKIQEKDRMKRKYTYAETLKLLDPNGTMPNENSQNEESHP